MIPKFEPLELIKVWLWKIVNFRSSYIFMRDTFLASIKILCALGSVHFFLYNSLLCIGIVWILDSYSVYEK